MRYTDNSLISDEDKIAIVCVIAVIVLVIVGAMIYLRSRVINREVQKMHPIVPQSAQKPESNTRPGSAASPRGKYGANNARVLPIVPSETEQSMGKQTENISAVRRNSLFEVDAQGLSVKINPALMSKDNSARSRRKGSNVSEHYSHLMSMY